MTPWLRRCGGNGTRVGSLPTLLLPPALATLVEDSSACTADGCGCGSGCTLTKLPCGSWWRPTGGATRLGVWARPVAMYEGGVKPVPRHSSPQQFV